MIMTRPGAAEYPGGKVEVEAKIGVLRDRVSGVRFALPVLVETGMSIICVWGDMGFLLGFCC
jgi:hypothetical protein